MYSVLCWWLFSQLSLWDPAPGYDGDAAIFPLLFRRNLEYPVSPDDVHVPTKCINCPVRLRHRHHRLGLRVLEGCVTLAPERHGHGEVLSAGLVRLHRCGVVVEWLPLRCIPIPVEPRGFNIHIKIISEPFNNIGECRTDFLPVPLVIRNNVTVSMPKFPQLLLRNSRSLDLMKKFVVYRHVSWISKQITNNDHVPGGALPVVLGQARSCHHHPHRRGFVTWIEVFCVFLRPR